MSYLSILAKALLAQGLLFCLLYVSWALCVRFLKNHSVSVLWCGMYVISCWLSSLVFHLLISFGCFSLLPASAIMAMLALGVWYFRQGERGFVGNIFSNLPQLLSALKRRLRSIVILPLLPFGILAVILLARIFILPLSGWDAFINHAFKAAWWVQTGADIDYNAPGAWEYVRTHFAGGSIFTAWAMLVFHADFLAGIPDFVHWVFLGLMIYALAREFQTPRWLSAFVAMMLLGTLELTQYVGTGFVDNGHHALLLGGVLFLCRFFGQKQTGELIWASAAFGVAVSIKITGASTLFFSAILCFIFILRHPGATEKGLGRDLLIAVAVFLLPLGRWLLLNYQLTGYPLGSLPLAIGPVQLGIAPPNYEWLQGRPDINPYSFAEEIMVPVRSLWRYREFLFFSLLGLVGLRYELKKRPWQVLALFCVFAGVLAFYLSPSFAVHRLGWPGNMGRFLLPCVVLPAAAGLGWLAHRPESVRVFSLFASLSLCLDIYWYGYFHLRRATTVENIFTIAAAFWLILTIVALVYLFLRASRGQPLIALIATVAIAAVALLGLHTARAWLYTNAYNPNMPHSYVDRALIALRGEQNPKIIAVTAGPWNIAQQWFVYPFLGREFENRVCYISPERDGKILPHHPTYLKKADPDYEAWMRRLRERGVTHVMSFLPATGELGWMEGNPASFVRLVGEDRQWGLFRYIP